MNILESLVTTGNIAGSTYMASQGEAELAIYGGVIATGIAIVDGVTNYFDRRSQRRRERQQSEWDTELIRLKAGY